VIDRFNFYDIYGYLLPGVLLFSLIWIPLGVLTGMWPPAEWSSAILMLALAYVIGHILHSLSDAALPFEFKDKTKNKNKRSPSDLLLDKDEGQVLTKGLGDLREKLAKQIWDDFKIDVKAGSEWDEKLFMPRLNAFLQCRNLLVRQKAASYAEQQQGMYVLMRGAATALLLSCVLYAGMGIGLSIFPLGACLQSIGRALLAVLFLFMIAAAIASGLLQSKRYLGSRGKEKAARCILFWLVAAAFFWGGLSISQPVGNFVRKTAALPATFSQPAETDPVKYREREQAIEQLQLTRQVRSHATSIVFEWTAISALLALICLAAYRSFAVNFALTIYRDYANAQFAEIASDLKNK
jgi:hypothetical protein